MRRKITKAGAGILAAALVMSTLPCGGVQAQAAAKKPSLSATSASLSVGSKLTLKVQNKAKGTTAKWKTSKKSVASVTQKGVVSGVKAGSATITCTLTTKAKKKTSLKCRVSVSANVEVKTQTQLNKALANKNVKNITIRTAARKTYTIAAGDYSAKGLIVKAPNAEVYNSGAFRAVTIKAIKADTWHENAKGNTIKVTAPQAHIIVAEGAEADSVRVMREGADVKIDVQGKAASVSVEEKATVAVAVTGAVDAVTVGAASDVRMDVDGSVGAVDVRKASTVTADVDGAIGAVAVSEKSALIFTGKTASIPVTVAAGAAGTSVSASAPVRVDTSADVSLELQKGAEGSAVNVNEKASVSVTGDAESASVTVAAGAAGSSVSASVPVRVDTSADVSVELQKGAEGSTVKTQDDSLTVGMDNKTDNAVKVETPSGEKTVNAGASQSVTGTTAQTVTPSAPSASPEQSLPTPPSSQTPSEAPQPAGIQKVEVWNEAEITSNKEVGDGEDTTARTKYNQNSGVSWDKKEAYNVTLPADKKLYFFKASDSEGGGTESHAWIALKVTLKEDFCSGASLYWSKEKTASGSAVKEITSDADKLDSADHSFIWWIKADEPEVGTSITRYIWNNDKGENPIEIKVNIVGEPIEKPDVEVSAFDGEILKKLAEDGDKGWVASKAAITETGAAVKVSPAKEAAENQSNVNIISSEVTTGGIFVKVGASGVENKWYSSNKNQADEEKPWISLLIDATVLLPADTEEVPLLQIGAGEGSTNVDQDSKILVEAYQNDNPGSCVVVWDIDASVAERQTCFVKVGNAVRKIVIEVTGYES